MYNFRANPASYIVDYYGTLGTDELYAALTQVGIVFNIIKISMLTNTTVEIVVNGIFNPQTQQLLQQWFNEPIIPDVLVRATKLQGDTSGSIECEILENGSYLFWGTVLIKSQDGDPRDLTVSYFENKTLDYTFIPNVNHTVFFRFDKLDELEYITFSVNDNPEFTVSYVITAF